MPLIKQKRDELFYEADNNNREQKNGMFIASGW